MGRAGSGCTPTGGMISLLEASRPEGANERSTGFLEQRLTPEGAELLRSEVISTGLIGDEDEGSGTTAYRPTKGPTTVTISPSGASGRPGQHNAAPVRHDQLPDTRGRPALPNQSGRRYRAVGDAAHGSGVVAAGERVGRPGDQSVRAVEDRYLVRNWWQPNSKLSAVLKLLPASAQELLRGKHASREPAAHRPPPGRARRPCRRGLVPHQRVDRGGASTEGRARRCGARRLRAGPLTPNWHTSSMRLLGRRGEARSWIGFEPILPHGEATCAPCG